MLYERFPELKYKYRNRVLVPGVLRRHGRKRHETDCQYIKHQLDEDQMAERDDNGNI